MIIDSHTHVFPDTLAERAIAKLSVNSGLVPSADGTVSGLIEGLDDCGIDKAVALNIATKPMQDVKVNDFALDTAKKYGDKLIVFGSVHPYSECMESELLRLKENGIKGIKLHPEYQRFEADDKSVFDMYSLISELGLLVTFHAGFDIAYPNSDYASPMRLARVLDRFPDMRAILAHMGGMLKWDEVDELIAGRDCCLDTAMCAGYIKDDTLMRLIEKHGVEKILFATDTPWNNWADSIAMIERLPLSKEEKEMIYHKNIERIIGER